LGGLLVMFASFVGFLHGFLRLQGKGDPESLGRYHDWPVVGGFFPKYVPEIPPPTEEEKQLEDAAVRLARAQGEYRLPPPYDADELKRLIDELAEARTKNEETRRLQEEQSERLKRAEADLAERQAAVTRAAEKLEADAKELVARAEELERERMFVRDSETKNLKTLAAVYEAMAPDVAAKKMEQLDSDTTAKLIAVMSERKAGKILGAMDIPKAVEITKRMQARSSADAARK
jgi:flagellar motility protein MotE (MotC chaperone)